MQIRYYLRTFFWFQRDLERGVPNEGEVEHLSGATIDFLSSTEPARHTKMALDSYPSGLVQDQMYIQMIASLFLKYMDQDSLNSVAKEINSMFI